MPTINFNQVGDFLNDQISKKQRKVALSLGNELVIKAAYRDGILASNFLVAVGNPSRFKDETPKSKSAAVSESQARIAATLASYSVEQSPVIYLQNNMPYAYRIMETGYSEQTAPRTLSVAIERAKRA